MFGLDADKVEIWDFFHRVKYASLEDKLDQTLEEARVLEGQCILLDLKVTGIRVRTVAIAYELYAYTVRIAV